VKNQDLSKEAWVKVRLKTYAYGKDKIEDRQVLSSMGGPGHRKSKKARKQSKRLALKMTCGTLQNSPILPRPLLVRMKDGCIPTNEKTYKVQETRSALRNQKISCVFQVAVPVADTVVAKAPASTSKRIAVDSTGIKPFGLGQGRNPRN